FSSRRRHTRSYGDWSSDVCSSNLQSHSCGQRSQSRASSRALPCKSSRFSVGRTTSFGERVERTTAIVLPSGEKRAPSDSMHRPRSEERRVGKEGRARWVG